MADSEAQNVPYTHSEETTPATTIRSLPPELVERILEFALEDLSDSKDHMQERYSVLACASRVCQTWSDEARSMLWRRVVIWNERLAQRLLSSPGLGNYQTKHLDLSSSALQESKDDMLKGLSACAVVTGLIGIEHLTLTLGRGNILDATVFNSASLQELISLKLSAVDFNRNCPPLLPMFSLQRLELFDYGNRIPLSLLPVLFSPSLNHLTVRGENVDQSEQLRDSFISVLPHLESLCLFDLPRPSWNHVFSGCVTLSCLVITFSYHHETHRLAQLFGSFPADKINTLRVMSWRAETPIVGTILASVVDSPSLKRLTHLFVMCKTFVKTMESQPVLKQLKERGVKIKINERPF